MRVVQRLDLSEDLRNVGQDRVLNLEIGVVDEGLLVNIVNVAEVDDRVEGLGKVQGGVALV